MEHKSMMLGNYIPIIIFVLLSLISISLKNIGGIILIFAIPYLFIERKKAKKSMEDIGFKPKSILLDIKSYWWLMLIPTIFGIIAVSLSKLILPDFYFHVLKRIKPMLSLDKLLLLIPQLLILAFGEEIAFRGFFQSKVSNIINPSWGIILTSLLFAISHFSVGSSEIIIYDLIFIFVDSVIYGIIFWKTRNIYTSTISHLIANIIGILILLFI